MSLPRVSVMMPMFNAADTVRGSVRSLQDQDFTDFEVLVVDDGSTDDGARIVRTIGGDDARVRLIQQANAGVSAARNRAAREATGEYLYWLDPDDRCCPGGLGALVEAAETNGFGAAVGHHSVVNSRGELLHEYRLKHPELGLQELIDGASTRCGSHVVRRELAMEGESPVLWDESLTLWEDREYWMRLAERGVRWGVIDCVVTEYVIQTLVDGKRSLSKRAIEMMSSGAQVIRSVFDRHQGEAGFSQHRFDSLLAFNALGSASRAAAIGGNGEDAAQALRDVTLKTDWSDEELVDAARFGVIYGCGVVPSEQAAGEWVCGLDSLWRELGADEGRRAELWHRFKRAVITGDQLACALLDRCVGCEGVVVLGYGHNGRAVVREAERRGLCVRVRDDAGLPQGVACEPMGAEIPEGWGVIVTPFADESLRARFGTEGAIFASDARETLVSGSKWDPAASVGGGSPRKGGRILDRV